MDAPVTRHASRSKTRAADTPPLISVRDVSKVYRLGEQTVRALDGVSFDIASGEFVAIMGPSGSGKSTMMNLIGALDTPSSGVLKVNGADIARMAPAALADLRNKTIGFVFQQFNLLARTSALRNVMLPLLYARPQPQDIEALARRRLELVGLGDRVDHHPGQLSGGQQQRVAIARALVASPKLLLADEPTGALDTATSKDLMKFLTQLNELDGITIVLITHEADIANWARRRIMFRDGRVVKDLASDSAPKRPRRRAARRRKRKGGGTK